MQTFWLLQTYLRDLAQTPTSNAFKTCRRVYNRVQRIVFGSSEPVRREKITDNVLPVTLLSSLVLGAIAAPFLPRHAGPLAIAQARRPRPVEETISDNIQPQRISRSHTVSGTPGRSRRPRPPQATKDAQTPPGTSTPRRASRPMSMIAKDSLTPTKEPTSRSAMAEALRATQNNQAFASTSSLPELPSQPAPEPPRLSRQHTEHSVRRHSASTKAINLANMSRSQKVRMLRSNYFRSQTQFLSALEDISNRLVAVPKPARLSALRAELALIAQDLPAEVDVPLLCPATLPDGSASRSQHHRIVRLNPAEATSLNSAERVPYLLMVEVLREDFDFDPESDQNTQLLTKLVLEKGKPKRRLFDITDASRESARYQSESTVENDSVLEPASGDLASPALLQELDGRDTPRNISRSHTPSNAAMLRELPRLSSGVSTLSSISLTTPRTSDLPMSRSVSPSPFASAAGRSQAPDQPDFSALATHMRAASSMLSQLDLSSSKRPKAEVAAIKARIIASMQSLEEQSFYTDDTAHATNFDAIMANANNIGSHAEPADIEDPALEAADADPNLSSNAGAARMENDIKTGGVQRKGDRDDPSAATFGEAWEMKKERIRRSSPYGWMKNWDLISMIVKTGADLRQEAFACQLIAVCSKIWAEANCDVWVKNMRILVTGESSGLIETITNGVSLHSLKRSLTLSSIASGANPRKRIATLHDHFITTFGKPDSATYLSAVDNFAKSLAAYSVISYILQLKDRHNGNILIDNVGHIVHIDFGFMLSNTPGSMGFEAAPFKLTQEYIDVLGGVDSAPFGAFKQHMKTAFQALRRDAERIVMLVELMGRDSKMPCYSGGVVNVVASLRQRFVLEKSVPEAAAYVDELVAKSAGSYYTRL